MSCNNGKSKKFNYLKYKNQPIKDQMPAITEVSFKRSDANAVNTNIIDQEVQY